MIERNIEVVDGCVEYGDIIWYVSPVSKYRITCFEITKMYGYDANVLLVSGRRKEQYTADFDSLKLHFFKKQENAEAESVARTLMES